MTIKSHLETLMKKHGTLENEIAKAMTHPSTEDTVLTDLKRKKLHIKEEIERIKAFFSPSEHQTAETMR